MTTQARELAKLVNNSGDVNLVDDITLGSDGALLNFGADSDVVITHVADTGLLLNSSRQLQFGDSGTHIRQSADGVLQLTSDTEVEINATTIDINGNVDISGNLVLGGNITIGDADSDDISFGGELTSHIIPNADDTFDLGSSTKQWRNVYVDGTLEADAITVDGTSLSVITTENVQDIVGAMVTSNTETNITVTYEDSDGTLDFVVPSTLSGVTELGTLTTLQVDNININGNTVTSTSSDLIVDASHNIYLDADGGNIVLQDGGTSFGQFIKSAGNLRIYNPISDGDIQILGNDGGSAITAVEFDMSNAGDATFNSNILINDGKKIKVGSSQDLEIYHSGSHSHIHDVGTGNFYLDSNGTGIYLTYNANNENMAQFVANGAVNLYHDNSKKFETTAAGITVTGEVAATSLDISGDVDVDGTLEADAITVNGTALSSVIAGTTLTQAAQTNITSVGTLTALTVDDITINGSTISDGADLTLDVEGDIILDANGGDIRFKDAGTAVAVFENDSLDFKIVNSTQDKDIIFRGNDGGSGIDALTLDMSAAGAATFNAGVTATTGTYSGLVTMGGIEVDQYVTHAGDTNTYMEFGTDTLDLRAGGIKGLTVNGNGEVVINEDQANIDLRVESDTDATAFRVQASSGLVSVGKIARGIITTDNDGSFDIAASNNFKCTPSGNFTLTFTNIAGQTGNILLINSGGHTVSAHANTKVDANFLATVSTAGTYLLGYFSDGTNVYMTNSAVYT